MNAFTDEEIIELANNLREGVPMATPVFDGATEQEIKAYVKFGWICQKAGKQLYLMVVQVRI